MSPDNSNNYPGQQLCRRAKMLAFQDIHVRIVK